MRPVFNFQLLPIPSRPTLAKFSHLKFKYRISQNGFVEKIPLPEAIEVGPALAAATATDATPANIKSCPAPMVHLQFVSNDSQEMDWVDEVADGAGSIPSAQQLEEKN